MSVPGEKPMVDWKMTRKPQVEPTPTQQRIEEENTTCLERDQKAQETRLRRIAASLGYRLAKSRSRTPMSPEFGGYQVLDTETGGVVHGFGEAFQYTADLDSVEEFLTVI